MSMVVEEGRLKFEFGRHETFALRENWIAKGLARVRDVGTYSSDLDTADALGLGSRMAKSLAFWLDAAGLIRAPSKKSGPALSRLGAALLEHDPFLEFPISWWVIHLELARRPGSVWNWFFNDFQERSFDRGVAVEAFERHVRDKALKPTTTEVLQREIACLLQTYARAAASEAVDPEDATYSPLRSLSLVIKHADTGRFERTRPLDHVPAEAFLAASSALARDIDAADVPLTVLLGRRNGPGRIFGLEGDTISELAAAASALYGKAGVTLKTLGADRFLQVPAEDAAVWVQRHFERIAR